MYIKERQDGHRTVFDYTPMLIPALLAATSAYLFWMVIGRAVGLADSEQPVLLATAGAIGLIMVAAWLCRRERMVFDPRARTLNWSKWSLRQKSGGEIGFDKISHLVVEVAGGEGVLSYRLVVETAEERIPMTSHFAGNPDYWEPLAERLRAMISLTADNTENEEARSLIAAGRREDAVRRLSEVKGMSMKGAGDLADMLAKADPA